MGWEEWGGPCAEQTPTQANTAALLRLRCMAWPLLACEVPGVAGPLAPPWHPISLPCGLVGPGGLAAGTSPVPRLQAPVLALCTLSSAATTSPSGAVTSVGTCSLPWFQDIVKHLDLWDHVLCSRCIKDTLCQVGGAQPGWEPV